VSRAYHAVLLDLFGTVVHFTAPPPRGRGAYAWLAAPLAAQRPDLALDDFARALLAVSAEIVAGRGDAHHELPSRERFRRALARLDPDADHAAAAEALSRAHMAHLAAQVAMPAAHPPLLRARATPAVVT
jgi:FMN phosphatase YigB (HAD superfamily)